MTTKSSHFFARLFRIALRTLPVALALAVVIGLVKTRRRPQPTDVAEHRQAARVIAVARLPFRPMQRAYGGVTPRRIWLAVAEVKGRVVAVHEQLLPGAIIDAGEVLVKIDPVDYELAVAALQASLSELTARQQELVAEERNLHASLAIEERSLTLAKKSLERVRGLSEQSVVPPDQMDREERQVLLQDQAIQRLNSQLALLPARQAAINAGIAAAEANLQRARIDLERTIIRTPYQCRLGDVNLEVGQVLQVNQQLFAAHGTDQVDVEARFRPEQLRDLLPQDKRHQLQPGLTMTALRELFDLSVTVRLDSGSWHASWPARFDRIRETADPQTRDIGVVAVVDNPFAQVIPGVRPLLIKGMFCAVELMAPVQANTMVLPASAVHNGHVFVLDADSRLRQRPVEVAILQGDLAVISDGLQENELVVLSDLSPAIDGMLIDPVHDHALPARLRDQAVGEEARP